ncbi:MAG: hypothetical protein COB46_00170 [Rhodospirillaceae bacterium]|nr:MAG: hypothetical protein COB46_00170 [Rhodospirillaceae bacterium]
MLDIQTENAMKITLVGAVYETAVANGREFKQDAERKVVEKRAEDAQEVRELGKKKTPPEVEVSLSKENASVAEPAPAPERTPPPPVRGGTFNLNA